MANKTPEHILTHCSYDYGTVTRRSDALTRGLTLLAKMTPEEQQELRKAVSNRPRTFPVYSTLIQFFIFLLDPTPKEDRASRVCY